MGVTNQKIAERFALYNGDSCEVLMGLPEASVDFSIFSPPFLDLYSYSDDDRDLSNNTTAEDFFRHFAFIVAGLRRVLRPGRIVAIHCCDVPSMKERDGVIGLKDFPGDVIRSMAAAGFIFHSRHIIWKDPLIEATRTKAIGLMHKQVCKDSTISRAGIPDQVLSFRAPGENAAPVTRPDGFSSYFGAKDPGGIGVGRSHNIWRAYASPVWMDIRQTRVLNVRPGRHEDDEKHLCPLQLDVIDRMIALWTNPGETVLTPFLGVGSEAYCAVRAGRRAIGIELKPSYFAQAVRNVEAAASAKDVDEAPLLSAIVDEEAPA